MSDIRITRPELTGLPRPRFNTSPYTNAVPFTVRNSTTAMEQQESIKDYLINVLVPSIDADFTEFVDAWNETADKIIEAVVSNAIELQDVSFAELITDENTESFKALTIFTENIIFEKPDDPGVFAVRQPLPVPPNPADPPVPDPNNPGFWI